MQQSRAATLDRAAWRLPFAGLLAIGACAFALALAVVWASPATAGDALESEAVVAHIFDEADTDDSGALDATEYATAGLARYGVAFEDSDLDGDGETTRAEYLQLYRAHHPPTGEARAI